MFFCFDLYMCLPLFQLVMLFNLCLFEKIKKVSESSFFFYFKIIIGIFSVNKNIISLLIYMKNLLEFLSGLIWQCRPTWKRQTYFLKGLNSVFSWVNPLNQVPFASLKHFNLCMQIILTYKFITTSLRTSCKNIYSILYRFVWNYLPKSIFHLSAVHQVTISACFFIFYNCAKLDFQLQLPFGENF